MTKKRPTTTIWQVGNLQKLFRKTRMFNWSLAGAIRPKVVHTTPDQWRGSANTGSNIITNKSDWARDCTDFDKFDWLRDLRAFGGSQARSLARQLIEGWVQQNISWHMKRWQPDIMGQRVSNMIFCYDWYAQSAAEDFQVRLTQSIALQSKCLALDWQKLMEQTAQITALKGLFVVQSAFGAKSEDLTALVELILPLIDHVTQNDGGHKSRMPDTHIRLMRDLVEIRNTASSFHIEGITQLDKKISKMASVCRMWRHADGQFARFNGAGETGKDIIEETLARAGQRGKVLQKAPHSGFIRLSSGRSTIIMDTGTPETDAAVTGLGTLAFEFAVGQNLLVVNPGQTAIDENLSRLLCSTKAHSTLTIDGLDSSSLGDNQLANVSNVEIGPAESGMLALATHDGYNSSHGVLHHRHLFLATGGGNLRGADTLEYTGAPGEIPSRAIVRFHLHPRVTAAMLNDQRILIKIRGNRIGWVFKSNAMTSLDSSLFFERNTRMNCQQIVLSSALCNLRTTGSIVIKWAFTRSNSD